MNQAAAKPDIERQVPDAAVQALEGVVDPEIPVLNIEDLGILRGLRMDGKTLLVTITPTYSGCPAMVEIRDSIHKALLDAGITDHRVETSLSPAWTTDWMSDEAKQKLLDYGIAPPIDRGEGAAPTTSMQHHGNLVGAAPSPQPVACPQCGSENTRLISQFGSTACKALYQCCDCQEPFDHFKCH